MTISACENDINIEDKIYPIKGDYFIFGHSYGECLGEKCKETFMIKGEALFEDTKDGRGLKDFEFEALSRDKYELVKDLETYVPSELWNELNEKKFGCPDCRDQGALIIRQSKNGKTKSWVLDTDPKDVPIYLHSLMTKIEESIVNINQ